MAKKDVKKEIEKETPETEAEKTKECCKGESDEEPCAEGEKECGCKKESCCDSDHKEESAEGSEETTEEPAEGPKDSEIVAEYKDRLLRAQAEFENFRKRSEKEKSEMFGRGVVSTLEKILPIIDNFERGLDSADDSPFAEGIKMIYKQLMTALDDMGVKEIPAEGETFDPNLHNAVMHEDDPEKGESEVSQVLQKGYTYNELVVRHAMVKVAN